MATVGFEDTLGKWKGMQFTPRAPRKVLNDTRMPVGITSLPACTADADAEKKTASWQQPRHADIKLEI